MRIAYLVPSYLPAIGGLEVVAHRLASVVHTQQEYSVTVIVPWTYWRKIRTRVAYRVLPTLPYSDRSNFVFRKFGPLAALPDVQLAIYQDIYKFDFWHVHSAYPSGAFAATFLKKRKLPALLTTHGFDIRRVPEINYGTRLDPAKDVHIRKTLQQFPRIVAISQSIRDELLACDVPAERIVDIPNGADVQRIQALPVDKIAVRRELGISPERKIILSVGRNQPVKGFDLIPKILVELLKSRNDFMWILVGPGSEQIEQLAIAEGVEAYLMCLPPPHDVNSQARLAVPNDELIRYFKSADFYVSTSRSEGFPGVLVEAMAAGLPLITTNATGSRDINNPLVGYMSAVDDFAGLASRILQLLDEPEQHAAFSKNAMVQSRDFDWHVIGARYMSEYEAIYSDRRAKSGA